MISISLVTPSFNKADFLEATLRSVLEQNYPALDYGIVDGGSTDATPDILARYKDKLSYVICEPDHGMYDALAKGFARSKGEIMGYLGADDLHMPWTLSVVAEVFERFPAVQWLTSLYPMTADRQGRVLKARRLEAPTADGFFAGANLPLGHTPSFGWIQQESTFWRRALWERAGGLDTTLKLAGDFDLWCRFMKIAEPAGVAAPLAAFRRHGQQITGNQAAAYQAEALVALKRHGGRVEGRLGARWRQLRHRLGLSRLGMVASFDFAENAWRC